MSAEPRQVANPEAWTQWEGQVVNGVLPLRRLLGASNHSAVFLTEYKANNLANAAIKFIPADALPAEAQLAQWRAAAKLSHPHLIQLFEVGRCELDGRDYLFVVMEHAEQTLAQILRHRALSADEVREILLPAIDALAFLHRYQLLHGQVKPSNFLAVDDQLKLARDTVRPAGSAIHGIARASSFDPPELKSHGYSAAGDVWGLGMTLVEALTQRTTAWPDEAVSLPPTLPAPFGSTVRRCLSLAPVNRPTVAQLEAQYKPAAAAPAIAEPPPPAPVSPPKVAAPKTNAPKAAAPQSSPKRSVLLPVIAVALLLSVAVWIGWNFLRPAQAPVQPPAVPAPSPVAPSTIAQPAAPLSSPVAGSSSQSLPPPAATSLDVLQEIMPEVPPNIRRKIQGRVFVTVRVLVDPSGDVMGTLMENPGPSKYFARLSDEAAGQWKFAVTDDERARVWLLRFAFTSDGVTVRTTAVP